MTTLNRHSSRTARGRKDDERVEVSKSRSEFKGKRSFELLQNRVLHKTNSSDLTHIKKILKILEGAEGIKGYVCASPKEPLYAITFIKGDKRSVFFLQEPVLSLPSGKQAWVKRDLRGLLDRVLRGVKIKKEDITMKYTVTAIHAS